MRSNHDRAWAPRRKVNEPTVLVVDDDNEAREWLRVTLSMRGWVVEEVTTAEQALERLSELRPDVVLLDHDLPGMKGIECAAALRQKSSELRIILASAFIDTELTKQARALQILPIAKTEHERLLDLFSLLAEQLQGRRAPAR
jgi:CheY-like chemotaxis protein